MAYIHKIDEMGGIVRAIEEGYPQRGSPSRPTTSSARRRCGERSIVGINKHKSGKDQRQRASLP